jgi:hypothetical protein
VAVNADEDAREVEPRALTSTSEGQRYLWALHQPGQGNFQHQASKRGRKSRHRTTRGVGNYGDWAHT